MTTTIPSHRAAATLAVVLHRIGTEAEVIGLSWGAWAVISGGFRQIVRNGAVLGRLGCDDDAAYRRAVLRASQGILARHWGGVTVTAQTSDIPIISPTVR